MFALMKNNFAFLSLSKKESSKNQICFTTFYIGDENKMFVR
jgi:hypothetical protein